MRPVWRWGRVRRKAGPKPKAHLSWAFAIRKALSGFLSDAGRRVTARIERPAPMSAPISAEDPGVKLSNRLSDGPSAGTRIIWRVDFDEQRIRREVASASRRRPVGADRDDRGRRIPRRPSGYETTQIPCPRIQIPGSGKRTPETPTFGRPSPSFDWDFGSWRLEVGS
jgi:hypothetical protein